MSKDKDNAKKPVDLQSAAPDYLDRMGYTVRGRGEAPDSPTKDHAPDLGTAPKDNAPFAVPAPKTIRRAAETEDLLNGLIAECHYLMREVAMPSAIGTSWEETRNGFLRQAMGLAAVGAEVAGAVAKLRIADRVSPEAQGRIIDAVAKTIVVEAKPA
jgi:hypothetical protein